MRKIIIIGLMVFLVVLGVSCTSSEKETIKVGLLITLTGTHSEVGIAVRDGFLLKMEEINRNGGINGREIEVIIKDDSNQFDEIIEITNEFSDAGINIIFGYELSSKFAAMQEVITGKEIIVISPTMSLNDASGINDNFFTFATKSADQGVSLGKFANRRSDGVFVLYDNRNRAFANSIIDSFMENFDGAVKIQGVNYDINEIEEEVLNGIGTNKFDSVLFILSPHDTVYMSQIMFRNNLNLNIYSSSWGMSMDIYNEGGRALEGAIFASASKGENEAVIEFKEKFKEKYSEKYHVASVMSYDAADFLFEALKKNDELEYNEIKKSLLELEIDGILGKMKLDEFGDSNRSNYIVQFDGDDIIYYDVK